MCLFIACLDFRPFQSAHAHNPFALVMRALARATPANILIYILALVFSAVIDAVNDSMLSFNLLKLFHFTIVSHSPPLYIASYASQNSPTHENQMQMLQMLQLKFALKSYRFSYFTHVRAFRFEMLQWQKRKKKRFVH